MFCEIGSNFEEAVIFDQALVSDEGEPFLEIPLAIFIKSIFFSLSFVCLAPQMIFSS